MMISQLATVAITARVRVSPATVPPKVSDRSKSRSRSFWSGRGQLRELGLGDVGLEVGPEDQGVRVGRRGAARRSPAG